MVFILGKKLPLKKRTPIALKGILGIGRGSAECICHSLQIDMNSRVKELTKSQITLITRFIKRNILVKGHLMKVKREAIQRLIRNKSYRGVRHRGNLPVRGQRTSSNGKTQKRLSTLKRKGR